ncbi:MAG: tRNA threonylcarbamoyladenosine biosynthesis protein TsaB [Cellvibrionaceae bacterium]|jgi:tRNA threonylcarbamoyladenosine biosynthesis protein TsaB
MPYLAIDTASRWTAIALYDESEDKILAEKGWMATLRQTVELAPSIYQMLADEKMAPADLTALVVAIGPGSYTGLRIGLSLARGLALVHELPIAAIPTHDIVAAKVAFCEQQLLVAVEAGRKRVLISPYVWQDGGWQQQGAIDSLTWPELLDTVTVPTIIAGEIPDDARELIQKYSELVTVAPDRQLLRSAGTLAQLGHQQIVSGLLPVQETLAPVYLRNP